MLKYFLFFENFLIWVSEQVPDLSVKLVYYDAIGGLNLCFGALLLQIR